MRGQNTCQEAVWGKKVGSIPAHSSQGYMPPLWRKHTRGAGGRMMNVCAQISSFLSFSLGPLLMGSYRPQTRWPFLPHWTPARQSLTNTFKLCFQGDLRVPRVSLGSVHSTGRHGDWVWSKPGKHSTFQASLGYKQDSVSNIQLNNNGNNIKWVRDKLLLMSLLIYCSSTLRANTMSMKWALEPHIQE